MESSEYAIQTEKLTKYYGKLLAVDHIDFAVRTGEVFGFLGPNGSGKTTTVRMLTTLLQPSAGRALVNGYDVSRQLYEVKRQFGLVPEESNVYVELTPWDNLMYTAKLYRVPKGERERRTWRLLEMFGLAEKHNVKAEFLSKGMRRRLTVAMALIHCPAILFMDELFVGLDVQSVQVIKEQLRQLNAQGTTIFLTTHQIELANQLCDRVAIINQGKIVAIDTPEQLKRSLQCAQSLEVSFEGGNTRHLVGLAGLPGARDAVRQGDKMRLYATDIPTLLEQVMGYSREQGVRLLTINTLGPSLEDVFMVLTGQEPVRSEYPANGNGHAPSPASAAWSLAGANAQPRQSHDKENCDDCAMHGRGRCLG